MLPSTLYIMWPIQQTATKFEFATSNCLGGDTFTKNVTDAQTEDRLWYKINMPFFLKKKSGYYDKQWWSRGQTEINGIFCEFVAPPRKKNLVTIFIQRPVF